MSLSRTLIACAAAAVLASGTVMAREPVVLTDSQMDDVTAGSLLGTGSNQGVIAELIALGSPGEVFKAAQEQTEPIEAGPLGSTSALEWAAGTSAIKAMLGGIRRELSASLWQAGREYGP